MAASNVSSEAPSCSNTLLYVGNLHPDVTEAMLFDKFISVAKILSIRVCCDIVTRRSLGYAYVKFQEPTEAKRALDTLNYCDVLCGRSLRIKWCQQADAIGPQEFTDIFIKNFGDQLDEEKLRELCSQHGKVLRVKIENDENGHSKGFGFCSFENAEEAEEAIQKLNGYSIGDKQLYVGRFQEKQERLLEVKRKNDLQRQEDMNKYQGLNLYIKNLDDTIDDERLRKEFSKFGTITSAKVMSENGRSRGFGFVCFSAPDEARNAVTEMNGSLVGSKALYVALAQQKEERRVHLTNQHMQRILTSRVPPQMQLPFPNGMGGMMSYLPTPMGPSQPRNFFPPTAMPSYRPPQPRWSSSAAAGGMRPQANPQMINMQMSQQAMTAAQRSSAMAGVVSRSGMPMSTRSTSAPGRMMGNNSIRLPIDGQQQQATYTRTVRNMPTNNPDGFGNSIVVAGQEPLTPAALANATPKEQKQILDERLFSLIQSMQPDLSGKITDMLLEIDNTELLHMLESCELLKAKVEETIAVLQAHQAKQLYVLNKQQ